MKLTDTDEAIKVLIGTTEPVDFTVEWTDVDKTTATTVIAVNSEHTEFNTAGSLQVVPPPSANISRHVQLMTFRNVGTGTNTLTIVKDIASTDREIRAITLTPGQSSQWSPATGWQDGPSQYQPVQIINWHADAGVNFAMTNATLAERFAGNATRHLTMVNLAGHTQVRLIVNKQVVGTAGSLFRAKYYTSYNTTVGNFLQLGLSAQVETSMAALGMFDSGWMDLALGARNDGICIGFTELGGDGAADPATGAVILMFR